jgi:hypothetical protein
MQGLQEHGCHTMVNLRKLKIFKYASPRRWRYYMECYKFGTLRELVDYTDRNK